MINTILIHGQNEYFEQVIDSTKQLYKNKNYKSAIELLKLELNNNRFSVEQKNQIFIELYKNTFWLDKVHSLEYLYEAKKKYNLLNKKEKSNLDYLLGNIHRILKKNRDSAIYYFLSSLKSINDNSNSSIKFKSNLYQKLASTYSSLNNEKLNYYYLKKNTNNLIFLRDSSNLSYNYNNIGTYFSSINHIDSSLFYYNKALDVNPNSKIKGSIYQNIGAVYLGQLNSFDSAEYYFDKAIKNNINKNGMASLYYNKAIISSSKNDYPNMIKYYQTAKNYADSSNDTRMKSYIFYDLSNYFEKQKKYSISLDYLKQFQKLNDSLNNLDLLKEIEELNIKFETEKKEKQIIIEKQNRIKNRNLLIGAITFIILGGTIMLLIQKNTRKKQKLAEQAKALESQKLATVLKEQELVSIDAMIEGQEKERQRIANDLHDDLGGLMATVKLHFNALKDKQTPELFDKTTTLLDDAYQKIRSIAHVKNSGVIAKQGLLIAVKNMTDKISMANTISVEVIHHGLENRLENSLELTIFRIIQELITNVIKHAEATEATIHLTNHDDVLNIMIEDNGVGFNPKQVTKNHNGMGISSIDKRVEHLNGKMTIESEKSIGTTIIIDIPI